MMNDKITIYSKCELEEFTTRKLLMELNHVRVYRSSFTNYAGPRCCEVCHEYVGSNWDVEIQPTLDEYDAYINIIKHVLSTREHIPNKQEAKAIRQEKAKDNKNR
jgi:hypothetical protein